MSKEVRHPLFARLYDRMAAKTDAQGAAEHRDRLLAGLSGRVLEVGAGNGLNFSHYPGTVTEVVAVEPEDYLRARARQTAEEAPVPIKVVDGLADSLPVDDASQDAVVTSLVLCSVPDQGRALAEVRRVLCAGGELRFYEHVVSEDPRLARLQNAVAWFWPRISGGCHPNRDTVAAIEASGLEVRRCERFPFRPSVVLAPVTPHVIGTARRP